MGIERSGCIIRVSLIPLVIFVISIGVEARQAPSGGGVRENLKICRNLINTQAAELRLHVPDTTSMRLSDCMNELVEWQSPKRIAESETQFTDYAKASATRISSRNCGWECWLTDLFDSWYLGRHSTASDYSVLIEPYLSGSDKKLINKYFGSLEALIAEQLPLVANETDQIKKLTQILGGIVLKVTSAKQKHYGLDGNSPTSLALMVQLKEGVNQCFAKATEASHVGLCVEQYKVYATLKLTPLVLEHYLSTYLGKFNAKNPERLSARIYSDYDSCILNQLLMASSFERAEKMTVACAMSGAITGFNILVKETLAEQVKRFGLEKSGIESKVFDQAKSKCTRSSLLFPSFRDAEFFNTLAEESPNFLVQIMDSCRLTVTEIFALEFSRESIGRDSLVLSVLSPQEAKSFGVQLTNQALTVCLAQLRSSGKASKLEDCETYVRVFGTFELFPKLISKEVNGMIQKLGLTPPAGQIDNMVSDSIRLMDRCRVDAVERASPGRLTDRDTASSIVIPCINTGVLTLAENLSYAVIDQFLHQNGYLKSHNVQFDAPQKQRMASEFRQCLEPHIRRISDIADYAESLKVSIPYCQNEVAKASIDEVIDLMITKELVDFGLAQNDVKEILRRYRKRPGNMFNEIQAVDSFEKLMSDLKGMESRLIVGMAHDIISVYLNKLLAGQMSKIQIDKYVATLSKSFLDCYPGKALDACVNQTIQLAEGSLTKDLVPALVANEFERSMSGYLPVKTIRSLKISTAVRWALDTKKGQVVIDSVSRLLRSKTSLSEIQSRPEVRDALANALMDQSTLNANLVSVLIDYQLQKYKNGNGNKGFMETAVIQNLEFRKLYNWRSLRQTKPGETIHRRFIQIMKELIAGRMKRVSSQEEKALTDLAAEGFKKLLFSASQNGAVAQPASRMQKSKSKSRLLWSKPGNDNR